MFKGFDIQLPEYTVVTPQGGDSYNVRSLTVAEVNKLKTSLVTPNKAHSLINDLMWKAIVSKPDHVTTYLEFKKFVTTVDREAILYGLYQATFGDDRDFNVECSNCETDQLVKLKLSDIFKINAYPKSNALKASYKTAKALDEADTDIEIEESIMKDQALEASENEPKMSDEEELAKAHAMGSFIDEEDEEDGINAPAVNDLPESIVPKPIAVETNNPMGDDIHSKKVKIELPISKVICYIRQPSVLNEEELMNKLSYATKTQGDLINETMIIDRFEQFNLGDKVPHTVIENRDDILYGFRSLPVRDKNIIFETYREKFGQYEMELKTHFDCNKCGESNDLEINITVQFFRMVGFS